MHNITLHLCLTGSFLDIHQRLLERCKLVIHSQSPSLALMANAGYLSVELFKLWFIDGVNGSAPYSFHDYQCELYGPVSKVDSVQ